MLKYYFLLSFGIFFLPHKPFSTKRLPMKSHQEHLPVGALRPRARHKNNGKTQRALSGLSTWPCLLLLS